MNGLQFWGAISARMAALLIALTPALTPARAAEEPDLIFKTAARPRRAAPRGTVRTLPACGATPSSACPTRWNG
jgi:hypothetical protein